MRLPSCNDETPMKQSLFFSSLLVLLLTVGACTKRENFHIEAVAPEDVQEVLIYVNDNTSQIDTIDVSKSSDFVFDKELAEGDFVTILAGDYLLTFINDGVPVKLDLDKRTVKGSAQNEDFADVQLELGDLLLQVMQTWESLLQSEDDDTEAADKLFAAYRKKVFKITEEYVTAHKHDAAPIYLLRQFAMDIEVDTDGYDLLHRMMDSTAVYAQHPWADGIWHQLRELDKAHVTHRLGAPFVDVKTKDINGETAHLSDYVGKGTYVLVDFWASWCGPCMAEMPYVIQAYDSCHDYGLDIVGISLDDEEPSWKGTVERLELQWPQLSDLNGWESQAAKAYFVKSIPSNFLYDPEGKLVAMNLRGDDLLETLADIFWPIDTLAIDSLLEIEAQL